jgi:hypothetical protein
MNLEIDKMLTLSTSHLTEKTVTWYLETNNSELVVFPKKDYGYFIFIGSDYVEELYKDIPNDLVEVIKFALKKDCAWLCLDRDAEQIEELDVYPW